MNVLPDYLHRFVKKAYSRRSFMSFSAFAAAIAAFLLVSTAVSPHSQYNEADDKSASAQPEEPVFYTQDKYQVADFAAVVGQASLLRASDSGSLVCSGPPWFGKSFCAASPALTTDYYYDWSSPCNSFDGGGNYKCQLQCPPAASGVGVSVTVTDQNGNVHPSSGSGVICD